MTVHKEKYVKSIFKVVFNEHDFTNVQEALI